jgi:hypothetical protein
MDVDAAAGELAAGLAREDLHVPREYQQIRLVIREQTEQRPLLLAARPAAHRQVVEGNLVPFDQATQVFVVGHHADDIHRQHAGAPAEQQVLQAMPELRHGNQDAHAAGDVLDLPGHVIAQRQRFELAAHGRELGESRPHGSEYRAHVEAPGEVIVELLGLDDRSVVIGEKSGDGRHDALAIRAHQEKRIQAMVRVHVGSSKLRATRV